MPLSPRCLAASILAVAWTTLAASAPIAQPAETDTLDTEALGVVEVTAAAPYALAGTAAPPALTVRERAEAETATDPALGLGAALAGVPGLWVSGRESRAQGERLLVRGIGWRAAFGVRGTHVLLDGVPLTLPDGQTQLDVVDPALVRRAEVVRGPASTFWGSGAGGVVALSTEAPASAPAATARAVGGGYGTASGTVAVRPNLGAGRRLAVWGSYLDEDGYRDHGSARLWRSGVSGQADVAGGTLGVVGLLAHAPRLESPGGISAEAAAEDPRQTREIVVARDASKRLTQGHLGVTFARPVGGVTLRAMAHGGLRALDNPIVPRYIELNRQTAGLRLSAEGEAGRIRWAVGTEGERQRDDRLESANDDGAPGEILTNQVETVLSGALFGRIEVPLAPGLTASAAARADALGYRADAAGLAADTRTLRAVSPSVGVAYSGATPRLAYTLFANAAGALDAPTTTELGNRPDGEPGFDPALEPERTWGTEAGARLALAMPSSGTLGLDLAVFAATVDDLLVPFEIDEVTFFRNESRTTHVGVEVGLQARAVPLAGGRLDGAVAYAYTRARFAESAGALTVEGNAVPGVPDHLATGTLTWVGPHTLPLVVGFAAEAASSYPADSANEAEADAYAVVHLRLGAYALRLAGGLAASPFVEVRNVGDARYLGSVVVNAFGGRYAEPAAGRHVLAGLTLTLR
ncbi:MAG: TonB-dependent receptor [Bacteroidota bacterium]